MPRVPSAAAREVGRRIREARERYSMTHDQLAASTGIDSSNIRTYESGRGMPSVQTLVRIASALATKPGEFIDDLSLDLFDGGETRKPRTAPQTRRRSTG